MQVQPYLFFDGRCEEAVECQVQEMSDFPPDVQKAAAGFSEMQSGQRKQS